MNDDAVKPGDLVRAKATFPYDTKDIIGVVHHAYMYPGDICVYFVVGIYIADPGHPAYQAGVPCIELFASDGETIYVVLHTFNFGAMEHTDTPVPASDLFEKVG